MNTVDNRVVEMGFDNGQFESGVKTSLSTLEKLKQSLNFKNVNTGFEGIERAANRVSLLGLEDAIAAINRKFSIMGTIGDQVIRNITNSIMGLGSKIASTVVGLAKSGGINRALNLESAKFQLAGLKIAWEDVYDSIDTAVSGTAYGLDAAAKAASQLAASGVQLGDDMTKALRAISGVAAMTNASYEEISPIFTTVAGQGQLMTMQLRQLESRGLNAAAKLGEVLGKTETEIRDMVHEGQIDFKTFAEAMDYAFGEHAKDANKTFTGSLSNVKAALSRLGAKVATPALEDLRDIFNSLRVVINDVSKALDPLINLINDSLRSAANVAIDYLERLDISGFATRLQTSIFNIRKSLKAPFKAKSLLDFEAWGKNFARTGLFSKDTISVIEKVAASHNEAAAKILKDGGGLKRFLDEGLITIEDIEEAINSVDKNLKAIDVYFMTDEMVEATGYTRDELKAIIKLRDEYNKTGSTFRDTMDELSKNPDILRLFADALRNVGTVSNTLSETLGGVFKEVFGTFELVDIYPLVKQFYDFSKTVSISDDTLAKLSNIFRGLLKIVEGFIGALKTIKSILSPLKTLAVTIFETFFHVLSDIGLLVTKIVDDAKSSTELQAIIENITDAIQKFVDVASNSTIFSKIIGFFDSLVDSANEVNVVDEFIRYLRDVYESFKNLTKIDPKAIGDKIFGWFTEFSGSDFSILDTIVTAIGGFFISLRDIDLHPLDWLSEGFSTFYENIKKVGEMLSTVFDPIKEFFEGVFGSITNAIGGLTSEDIIGLLNTGLLGSIVLLVKKDVVGVLDSVRQCMENFQESLKADVLYKIAKSIAILAGSLIALAFIKTDRLWAAFGVLSALATVVTAMYKIITFKVPTTDTSGPSAIFKAFSSLISSYNKSAIYTIAKSIAVMSVSLLVLTGAMYVLSKLSWGGIAKGVVSLAAMAAVLALIATYMNKFVYINNKSGGIGKGLISIALAIGILAISMAALSKLNWESIGKGLVSVIGLLLGLAGAVFIMAKARPERMVSVGAGLMGMALAIMILTGAVAILGHLDLGVLKAGLGSVLTLIAVLAVAVMAMSGSKVLGAAVAITAMAASILLLTGSVAILGHMDLDSLIKGMAAVITLIVTMAAAMWILSGGNTIKASVAILAMTASLLILAPIIKLLSTIPFEGVIGALLSLAGVITIFGFAAMALEKYIGSMYLLAGALVVFSAALLLMVPAFMAFSAMKFEGIIKAFVAIAGVIAILGVAAMITQTIIGPMFALAGIIALFSISALALAAALAILGPALSVAAASIVIFVEALLGSLGILITGLAEMASRLVGSFVTIASAIIELIVSLTPQITNAIMVLLASLVQAILSHVPEIVESVVIFIVDVMNGIATYMPIVVEALSNMIISVINTLADTLRNNADPLLDAVESLIEAILETAITGIQHLVEKIPVIGELASGGLDMLKEGMRDFFNVGDVGNVDVGSGFTSAGTAMTTASETVVDSASNGLSVLPDIFSGVGTDSINSLVTSFTEGSSGIDMATSEISNMMSANFGTDMTGVGEESLDSYMAAFQNPENFAGSFDALSDSMTTELGSIDLGVPADTLMQNFTDQLSTGTTEAEAAGETVADSAVTGIDSKESSFRTAGSSSGANFGAGVRKKKGDAQTAGTELATSTRNGVSSGRGQMVSVGEDLALGTKQGIMNKAGEVAREASKMVTDSIAAARRAADSASPSKKMIALGEDMDRGAIIGLKNLSGAVDDTAGSVVKSSLDVMRDTLTTIGTALFDGLDLEPTIRPVLDMTEIQNGTDYMNSLFSSWDVPVGTTAKMLGRFSAIESANATTESPMSKALTFGDTNITVNAAPGQDADEIANTVMDRITDELFKAVEVYA